MLRRTTMALAKRLSRLLLQGDGVQRYSSDGWRTVECSYWTLGLQQLMHLPPYAAVDGRTYSDTAGEYLYREGATARTNSSLMFTLRLRLPTISTSPTWNSHRRPVYAMDRSSLGSGANIHGELLAIRLSQINVRQWELTVHSNELIHSQADQVQCTSFRDHCSQASQG